MNFVIEKNIPMPPKPSRRNGFPFMEMEIGESFAVDMGSHTSWAFIFTAIQYAQSRGEKKFTTRLIDARTRRVWRVA